MRIYGYARVSTKEQKLDRQLVELKKIVDERFIFMDKISGKDMDRKEYQLLRKIAQNEDVIYITSLDRLGRNKEQIKQELEYYKAEGIRVKILDIPTSMMDIPEGQEWIIDMINNLLIEVLSTIAEQERRTIKKRQADGITAAKDKGIQFGRPKTKLDEELFKKIYIKWNKGQIKGVEAMKELGLSKATFYRRVKEYKEMKEGQKL